jgi:hypothetical protein
MDEDDEGAGDISTSSDVPQLAIDRIAGQQTDDLLADARAIMEQAERDGVDPDERLREILQRAVREGFRVGGNIGAGAGGGSDANLESPNAKRSRGE